MERARDLLGSLPFMSGVETRQISAENPTGRKGQGCLWEPDPTNPETIHSGAAMDLGKGWMVRPFISLPAHATVTLADVAGPGCINGIFLTSNLKEYRALASRSRRAGGERGR